MRAPYFFTLIAVLIIGGVYWYKATSLICPVPLYYSIGSIDPSFNLSKEEALAHIKESEKYWEDSVGRDLFTYREDAPFKVNFIFDERQAVANEEENSREYLDAQRKESDSVKASLEKLQNEYNSLLEIYNQQVASYETRLKEYNAEVNKYNDRGGAPADVYEDLENEREVLAKEVEDLNQTESKLSRLAEEINQLGEKGNELVNSYNKQVNNYNSTFGHAREFTQGDYQGTSINIYKFSSNNELYNVLVHEFGHALGIPHVEDSSSVMYYLLEDTESEPLLSANDLSAYYEVCGTTENFKQKIRRLIREFLLKIDKY